MSNSSWKKDNTVSFNLRFTMNSGVPFALRKMEDMTGESQTAYIRRVVIESLSFDGYLTKEEQPPKQDKK